MKTTHRYRTFKPPMLLFHLTWPDNLERIESEGLRADSDGNIFAFTDLIVADSIAAYQVFTETYALLWLHPRGITSKLYADDVGELTRRFQCIIRQERIEPRYVHYLGTMRVQTDRISPWQRLLDASRGLTRQQSEDLFRQMREAVDVGTNDAPGAATPGGSANKG